ncbi:MAG: ORF6N domain-containing protein [Clostridium sp.]|nr:ORF6N domain-containing protein [Clostridium sp.]
MNEIKVAGKQKFMGLDIPVVLGGFGEGKKCISDKTIAEIHGMREPDVRRRITDNIKRFEECVDYIDLAQRVGESHTLDNEGVHEAHTLEILMSLGYTKSAITQAEHIYILSERGYAKLIKIMDTDLAWEIHNRLMDEYFEMREEKQRPNSIDAAVLKGLSSLGNLIRNTMKDEKAKTYETAEVLDSLFRQGGLVLPKQFIQIPE